MELSNNQFFDHIHILTRDLNKVSTLSKVVDIDGLLAVGVALDGLGGHSAAVDVNHSDAYLTIGPLHANGGGIAGGVGIYSAGHTSVGVINTFGAVGGKGGGEGNVGNHGEGVGVIGHAVAPALEVVAAVGRSRNGAAFAGVEGAAAGGRAHGSVVDIDGDGVGRFGGSLSGGRDVCPSLAVPVGAYCEATRNPNPIVKLREAPILLWGYFPQT